MKHMITFRSAAIDGVRCTEYDSGRNGIQWRVEVLVQGSWHTAIDMLGEMEARRQYEQTVHEMRPA